ncbi:TM0106 family RecB-like putative nuclease [Aphanizomenon sp. CS-733/32]|uniref:TM0106 family RecB-like putative nuclease n=1 Tax=Aphanizomenon sp. CS-733/32 TaxID=3021715 RepID=UPI002330B795|nr:TM0106 family RecB-like putative nuclease [Aphanizomenon sp. CS-733/32]MDB9311396.1 TM0106 family RecB-like putative nuclease [Aphanizomenon sp. CS-733/32]
MLINAQLLLQFQRCQRRPFLDVYGDYLQREITNELMLKVQQDKNLHHQRIVRKLSYYEPDYVAGDWQGGAASTLELMQQGVSYIRRGVILTTYRQGYTLLSRPDLLVKQPGKSRFGNWNYVPVNIELGKRPKQEYQVVIAFHAQVLATVQDVVLRKAGLILRDKDKTYVVDLDKWTPQMLDILGAYIQVIESLEAPEIFISRQKCNLCPWYNYCYEKARSQDHLSLLPGVTPIRYTQLQNLDITTLAALAQTHPSTLENLTGFDSHVAAKLVVQAQSVFTKQPLILPDSFSLEYLTFTAPIELYFDIEAQPDLNLNYLLGVLVVDRVANTEKFYAFLAEEPEQEPLIWQQFLNLVNQYPQAPIYHFCAYEVDTVKRLGKLYRTPHTQIHPLLNRFIDIYEQLIQSVALPIDSYALKTIARWVGFEWREQEANGAKCIYWYDKWLETGDRTLLELIQDYNEDDCRATRTVKDWLVSFFTSA